MVHCLAVPRDPCKLCSWPVQLHWWRTAAVCLDLPARSVPVYSATPPLRSTQRVTAWRLVAPSALKWCWAKPLACGVQALQSCEVAQDRYICAVRLHAEATRAIIDFLCSRFCSGCRATCRTHSPSRFLVWSPTGHVAASPTPPPSQHGACTRRAAGARWGSLAAAWLRP